MLQQFVATVGRKHPHLRKLIKPLTSLCSLSGGYQATLSHQINGFTYQLNLDDYIQSQMYYFGLFDMKGVDLIVKVCRMIQCRTALDIGANVGNHAVFLSSACERVYSFEPNDTPGDVYRAALATKESNITLFDVGLSDSNETMAFYENSANLGGSSFVREHLPDTSCIKKMLEVKNADDFIEENDIGAIDFIKIDVEGFEAKVLSGLSRTIAKHSPIIDFEFNPITREAFGSVEGLNAALDGYSFYGTKGVGLGLINEQLRITDFDFQKDYSHVLAVPNRFAERFDAMRSN